jgi:hypothetical protein
MGDFNMGELIKSVAGQPMKYVLGIDFSGTERPSDDHIK